MENLIPKAVDGERNQNTKIIGKRKRDEEFENPEDFFKYPNEDLSTDFLNNFYEEPIDGPISHTK